jgi:hypothetical protein
MSPFPWEPPPGVPIPGAPRPWLPPHPSYPPPPSPALGSWTYRAFIDNPDVNTDFNDLYFGLGELTIEELEHGRFEGRLWMTDTHQLRLRGAADLNSFPSTIRFRGIGDTKHTRGWVYDYLALFVPMWSNGEKQRPALVGTTVRTVEHGHSKPGVVASFIAVKRDE